MSTFETPPPGEDEENEFAARGLVDPAPELFVTGAEGRPVWDLRPYAFLAGAAPATVHPNLWAHARRNLNAGLFEVAPGIFQVRGFDISNLSVIEADAGLIVVDPLISVEVARAALELYFRHRPRKPVLAVIYTHSHVDHFGGVRGVTTEEDVAAGRVRVIAPQGFMEAAIRENLLAGHAMGRRATYMYGNLLPRGPRGQVDAGIGKATSTGTVTLIPPTHSVTRTGEELDIGGVKFVFQLTPDTEAPAEMNFHLPQLSALHLAENANACMHNVYTLRGAQVRDAKGWAHYLREALRLFGSASEVMFTGHCWPRWGRERIAEFVTLHADAYQYVHDQTLRLANHGCTMEEIAEALELPEPLAARWYNRGFYGSVRHNAKAVYQRYLGWFDGNPARLDPLPPQEAARKYVEYMGGAEAVLARAEQALARGEFRWVAQVASHVVFAEPDNKRARALEADALEQLGYRSESAPWRNFYLTGAQELRHGVRAAGRGRGFAQDMVRAMTLEMFFDYLAMRLNGPKAAAVSLTLNFVVDGTPCALTVRNGVLRHEENRLAQNADATLVVPRLLLAGVAAGQANLREAIAGGKAKLEGNPAKLVEFFGLFDTFDPWFEIVAP